MKKSLSVIACLALGSVAGCAPVPVADAPGARIEAPAPRAGARWTYDVIDPYRREVVGSFSQAATGGAQRQEFSAPYAKLPFPLTPGMQWDENIEAVGTGGRIFVWRIGGRARGWERVRTPAGEFDALRIVHTMNLGDGDGTWQNTTRAETLWYAPAVNGWVRLERRDNQRERAGMNPRTNDDWRIWELREHHPG